MNNSQNFTITTWGPERPPVTFPASSAAEAYDIVLDKAVYASLQVKVTNNAGQEISLDQLSVLAQSTST